MLEPIQVLTTNFRRWAAEVKRLITSVDHADYTLTTEKINGRSLSSLIDEIRALVADHENKHNPHKDSSQHLNIYSKKEFDDLIVNMTNLEDFPISKIPQTVHSIVNGRLVIEGVRMVFRGVYVMIPTLSIALPAVTAADSYVVAYTFTKAAANLPPIPSLSLVRSTTDGFSGVNTTYRYSIGTAKFDGSVWTITTTPQVLFGVFAVSTVPRGNAIPVTTGRVTEVMRLGPGWRIP